MRVLFAVNHNRENTVMTARGTGFFKTFMPILTCILFAFFSGCDDTTEAEESLWLGMIDPSNTLIPKGDGGQERAVDSRDGNSLEDSGVISSDSEAAEGEILSGSKDRAEHDKDSSLGRLSEGNGTDSDSSEKVIESDDEEEIHEEQETGVIHEGSAEASNSEPSEPKSAEPTPKGGEHDEEKSVGDGGLATVSFTVDFSCAGDVHEQHVYVLGMDQWNTEWAIATQLTRIDDSHHYSGTWEGAGGDYTFLVSHGMVDEGEINPWSQVEDIEGQDCVADAYGNRGVSATAGNNTTIVLTFGYCDGCPETCTDACGGTSSSGHCFCDSLCEEYDDCCDDYHDLCAPASCDGNCGGHNTAGNCYCDKNCSSYNDCCPDYQDICVSEEI